VSGAGFRVRLTAVSGWSELASRQAGVLCQRQLNELAVSRAELRHHLRMRRWARRTDTVVTTTTGPLSREQQFWVGVLHAGPDALIGGLTAAEVLGLRHWHRDEVTVLVHNPQSFEAVEGVRFFRTRRPLEAMASRRRMPVARIEPAVLLFAAYERQRRTAHGALAAVVQQRLTTPGALAAWMATLRPLPRSREFAALFGDLQGGAQSLAEVDLGRACREHGVVPPRRQTPRLDRSGRGRWTDAEWDLPEGRTLVLEVDGGFHDDVVASMADRSRGRKLTSRNRIVVSCSAYELRYDPGEVMSDLIALGVSRCPPG